MISSTGHTCEYDSVSFHKGTSLLYRNRPKVIHSHVSEWRQIWSYSFCRKVGHVLITQRSSDICGMCSLTGSFVQLHQHVWSSIFLSIMRACNFFPLCPVCSWMCLRINKEMCWSLNNGMLFFLLALQSWTAYHPPLVIHPQKLGSTCKWGYSFSQGFQTRVHSFYYKISFFDRTGWEQSPRQISLQLTNLASVNVSPLTSPEERNWDVSGYLIKVASFFDSTPIEPSLPLVSTPLWFSDFSSLRDELGGCTAVLYTCIYRDSVFTSPSLASNGLAWHKCIVDGGLCFTEVHIIGVYCFISLFL